MISSYRWMIVALGGLMGCVAIGAMFSLAVFIGPISAATGWSRAAIASAMTLDFLVMGLAGFGWGMVSDRVGPRPVVLSGAILLGAGLWIASRATSPLMLQLGFGVLVGGACGAFIAPVVATVTGWFDTQRALAVSLVSAGMGMAPLTMSPLVAWLVSHYDWRTAMAAIAWLAWAVLIPVALLMRGAPAARAATPSAAPIAPGQAPPRVGPALRSVQFVVLGGTFFLCCAAHSGPLFHFVSYAIGCGLPIMAAVSVYSVEGLAGLGGRLLFGIAADRLGVKPVLIAGLLVQAVAIQGYLFASRQGEFYLLGVVFGTAYSGVMPLYAVLAREYFDQRIMGTVYGAAIMLSSLGMALGPVVGGWVFDTYHDYRWLYLGSTAVAVAAAAVACAFPPFNRAEPRAAVA
ncbi:MAG TPA: MFS transporter [Steroidobacteraceae bacterium]|nr:MFS transporter [Steroidobacteraceae bacterium]